MYASACIGIYVFIVCVETYVCSGVRVLHERERDKDRKKQPLKRRCRDTRHQARRTKAFLARESTPHTTDSSVQNKKKMKEREKG